MRLSVIFHVLDRKGFVMGEINYWLKYILVKKSLGNITECSVEDTKTTRMNNAQHILTLIVHAQHLI